MWSIVGWFVCNGISNYYTKTEMLAGTSIFCVTASQYIVGAFFCLLLLMASPRHRMGLQLTTSYRLLASSFLFAVGNMATNISISFLTLSFAQVIKSTEPIFCALLMIAFKAHVPSLNTSLSILITCSGAIVASDVELGYHWKGVLTAIAANVFLQGRNIVNKDILRCTKSEAPSEECIIIASLLLSACCALGVYASFPSMILSFTRGSCLGAATFVAYQFFSLQVLDAVSPIMHAMLNSLKRVFLVASSILVFHDVVHLQWILGSALTLTGVTSISMEQQKLSDVRVLGAISLSLLAAVLWMHGMHLAESAPFSTSGSYTVRQLWTRKDLSVDMSRPVDVLFVGCFTADVFPAPNKGDYMYRDVWTHVFGKNFTVRVTHQARVENALTEINMARRVVFGGGGLLYHSGKSRDDGKAELKILQGWHRLLKQSRTPYGLASIGFQPKDFPSEPYTAHINVSGLDGGIYNIVRDFVKDATFITARSSADEQLFKQWNNNVYEYPDLAFSLRILGIVDVNPQSRRTTLVTIGSTQNPNWFKGNRMKKIRYLATQMPHYHITISKDDMHANFSQWGVHPMIVDKPSLTDQASYFAEARHVLTTRYHGLIMAELLRVPSIDKVHPSWKMQTFRDQPQKEELSMNHLRHVYSFLRST